jgi:hypothetical protein
MMLVLIFPLATKLLRIVGIPKMIIPDSMAFHKSPKFVSRSMPSIISNIVKALSRLFSKKETADFSSSLKTTPSQTQIFLLAFFPLTAILVHFGLKSLRSESYFFLSSSFGVSQYSFSKRGASNMEPYLGERIIQRERI